MLLLHAQFTEWAVKILSLPGGSFGMYSILILIVCSIITGIGLITVILFRKIYGSIVKIAILFEIIYLFFLIITGNNPFLYFSNSTDENVLTIMMYFNALIIFFLMYVIHKIYSKFFHKNY